MSSSELDEVRQIPDPAERARRASVQIAHHQALVGDWADVRRRALEEMKDAGWTRDRIAEELGITGPRVSQLQAVGNDNGGQPAKTFLAKGSSLTVAVGGTWQNSEPTSGPVVSPQDLSAYEVIATLAGSLQIDTTYEIVPPPGLVRLNRPDLLVLSSPRLLPVVGQQLDLDPHYGFGSDAQGWFLVDKEAGVSHRSPADKGEALDYAYLGRLPRPDRRGSFICMAGIHPQGTLGAAHYLREHFASLWKQARNRRFSLLLACRYAPSTGEITDVTLVAPLRRHGTR
ncbi:hypothetical protein OG339_48190 (plasmid) [Streptosporangium sp. NBC_01495]|uniref:hypothetical protein n=1 Tax=Streptosporangium sp. NBC_01495 TaxID=2903899 RepID=UPI002E3569B3|nr:hypothetical protein [Streptosporangium sp. NBC_01495]